MKRPARKVHADDDIPAVGAAPKSARPKVDPAVETFDVPQSAFCEDARSCSPECEAGPCWFKLRLGIPTASNFGKIMAKSDERAGRAKYMRQLAGEILTGVPAETYQNAYMQRGKDMEEAIRSDYAFTSPHELTPVGFVRRALPRGRFVGCSPDSFVGVDGSLEIKTMQPDLLIELAESGRFPNEHRWQCHGANWVTGREFCDLRIGYARMPVKLTFRVNRDEALIRELSDAVEVFDYELKNLVERMRMRSR